ncbi:hypothetical protein H9N25_21835 [Pedobacter riviphilus]|uniref:Uncharacterized protein n=1 Tax=Pedobacter riviphilus TaxID=2766984 RepID=A0ABX6TMV6_9SPHI|nr:hypothetical protein [Pedobacter riviphilus]QNR84510.1 hypothetical protein H9N25_21835 [Pedobacter riviphilus]
MEIILITIIAIVVILGFLYYSQNKGVKDGVEKMINQVERMSDTEWARQVNEKQMQLEKTVFKNVVTKESFVYFEQGNFIRSGSDIAQAKFLKIVENQTYIEEFYTEPRYSVAGRYNTDYYIIYYDGKAYVSLSLLQTLYLFDESKWRKILYPVEFIDGYGYNFSEFLKLSLPGRHPNEKWLEDTSTETCNRLYFKDLTVEEILSVPAKNPH